MRNQWIWVDGYDSTTLVVGDTVSLRADVGANSSDNTVCWKTSDSSIASVDSNGKVTANAPGTVTITAYLENHPEINWPVVFEVVIKHTKISISNMPVNNTLYLGDIRELKFSFSPNNAENNFIIKSNDENIVKVNNGNTIKAISTGKVTLEVTCNCGFCNIKTNYQLTIVNKTVNQTLAKASNLNIATANRLDYNCYGNAIKKCIKTNPTGYKLGDSTEEVFQYVVNDLGPNNIRRLDKIDSPIYANEYRVAMRCRQGSRPDYHFIRQDEKGWYNKSGETQGIYLSTEEVNAKYWYPSYIDENGKKQVINQSDYDYMWYDDKIIYFAIKAGWDN